MKCTPFGLMFTFQLRMNENREISFNLKNAFVHCIRYRFLVNADLPF